MNSRLNMALRERRGFSYSAESHYLAYTDSGAINIYFSSDKDNFAKSLEVTRGELKKLRNNLIPEKRLQFARKQLLGQIAISSENSEHLMLTMAKSFMLFNLVDALPDIPASLHERPPFRMDVLPASGRLSRPLRRDFVPALFHRTLRFFWFFIAFATLAIS